MTHAQRILHIPRPGRLAQYIKAHLDTPRIETGAVDQILSRYGLELTHAPKNLSFGGRNHNLVLHTSGGKKVLKRYRKDRQLPTILHEHSIINRLAECQFSVPHLVTTDAGELVVKEGEHYFALFEFVPGKNFASSFLPRLHRQKLLVRAAKTLAQFHRQLNGFMPAGIHHLGFESYSGNRHRDLTWLLDRLDTLPEKSRNLTDLTDKILADRLVENTNYIKEKLCQLDEALNNAQLLRLVIHGDFGIHNLHFHSDGTATLLDFELARLDWRLVDLITVLPRLRFDQNQSFLATYQAEYPLIAEEWHYFPVVWQFYKLQGAVQYWHTYFEVGGSYRLAAAHERIVQAAQTFTSAAELPELEQ